MHEDDRPGFWALMFSQFRQRADKDAIQFIGRMIAMRYEAGPELPAEMSDLLARLSVAEQDRQAASSLSDGRPRPSIPGSIGYKGREAPEASGSE